MAVLILGVTGYAVYMNNRRLTVNPVTYKPLLHLIAQAESKNNYNAYFGNAANSSIRFTDMSIAEVMKWQKDYIKRGSPSDAVGRYQIISTTLAGLVQEMNIDKTATFDAELQDKMAITLLERRGSKHYVNNDLSPHQFAANLSKEWAALPKVVGENPEASYYAGDGLNKSLVSVNEVLSAIEPIEAR